MIFLIDYSRKDGKIADLHRFGDDDRAAATALRLAKDLEYNRSGLSKEHEVVILEAATEDLIRRSHARYFQTLEELVASAA